MKAEIQANTKLVTDKVHQSIVAFLFYDKLVQRLDHVCHGLSGLSGIVADRRRLYSPTEWKALQDRILAKYSMAEERAMFESVLKGAMLKEALECACRKSRAAAARSSCFSASARRLGAPP